MKIHAIVIEEFQVKVADAKTDGKMGNTNNRRKKNSANSICKRESKKNCREELRKVFISLFFFFENVAMTTIDAWKFSIWQLVEEVKEWERGKISIGICWCGRRKIWKVSQFFLYEFFLVLCVKWKREFYSKKDNYNLKLEKNKSLNWHE